MIEDKITQRTVACTIFGEARGEKEIGMRAVGEVIVNRANKPCWWGKTLFEVCRKPKQFSCFNLKDVNYIYVNNLINRGVNAVKKSDLDTWRIANKIANEIVSNTFNSNLTFGANHYHTIKVNPYWAAGITPVAVIGNHKFYRA